jgi:hypothetical protein
LYLELGSLNLLMKELRKRGIRTKVQQLKSGRTIGGIPFARGSLSYLLRNRFFVGEVVYKGEALPGPQPPILDRALFDAVQAKFMAPGRQEIACHILKKSRIEGCGLLESQRRYQPRLGAPGRRSLGHDSYGTRSIRASSTISVASGASN